MIKQIAQIIKDLGGTAYYVGGFVRDNILGIENKDIDVEVYGLTIDELTMVLSRFGKVKDVGKSFGVLKLNEFDFSIPRSETKNGNGYTGFDIVLDPFATIAEACKRRDITINAIMQDILTGEIIDPYNGLKDLKNGFIKHVNAETFAEDPLRVLRVPQFASRFDFMVHTETITLCQTLKPELKHLTSERIFIEIEKMLMRSIKPSIAFNHLYLFGAIEVLFPELYDLVGIEQGTLHHSEGDVWEHTMLALDYVKKEDRTLELMLAILLHDLGKVSTGEPREDIDHVSFHGHEKASVPLAETFLRRITNEKSLIDAVLPLVEHHMAPYLQFKDGVKKKQVRRLILKCDVPLLMQLHVADKCSREDAEELPYVARVLELYNEVKDEIAPIVKGRHLIEHLGLNPGKIFKEILDVVYEAQLDGIVTTVEEGIEWIHNSHEIMELIYN